MVLREAMPERVATAEVSAMRLRHSGADRARTRHDAPPDVHLAFLRWAIVLTEFVEGEPKSVRRAPSLGLR